MKYILCDICSSKIYETDDSKVYEGRVLCMDCWRDVLECELFENYIPNHFEELLEKAAEEMEGA